MKSAIELPGYKHIYKLARRYGEAGVTKVDIAKATGMGRRELSAKIIELLRQGFIKELDHKCHDPARIDNDGKGAALYAPKRVAV